MKAFLAVIVLMGVVAHMDAFRLRNSREQGQGAAGVEPGPLGNPFFQVGGNSQNGDSIAPQAQQPDDVAGTDTSVEQVDSNPGNPSTPGVPDSPDTPDAPDVDEDIEEGDTPDGNDIDEDRISGGQPVYNDREAARDPGQIVGGGASTGATVGVVAGVVGLVGIAAGVAVFVIKRRN